MPASDGAGLDSISTLMGAAQSGDPSAAAALFDVLYSELHRLARRELGRHGIPVSLGATTLLHEAYLDMAQRTPNFPDRARFMTYAARVMRGVIIDHVRRRCAQKRGGMFELTSMDTETEDVVDEHSFREVSDALDELAKTEPALTEIVDLKFFCGFSFSEIAAMQGLSERTIQRQWDKARIYLFNSIRADLTR